MGCLMGPTRCQDKNSSLLEMLMLPSGMIMGLADAKSALKKSHTWVRKAEKQPI
jgi:hypothetical protein